MTEADFMPAVRVTWANRVKHLGLKPGSVKRKDAIESYLQGVLAVALATGVMSYDRCNQITFLVMVGRAEEFLAEQEGDREKAGA